MIVGSDRIGGSESFHLALHPEGVLTAFLMRPESYPHVSCIFLMIYSVSLWRNISKGTAERRKKRTREGIAMSDEYAAKMCDLLEKMCTKLDEIYEKLEEIQGVGADTSISDVYDAIKESEIAMDERLDRVQGDGIYNSISDVHDVMEEVNKNMGKVEGYLGPRGR